MQDTLEVHERCSVLALPGNPGHDEGVHAFTSEGTKKANFCLKDLFISHNKSFLDDSQIESTTVLGRLYNTFGFKPLLIRHPALSKLPK